MQIARVGRGNLYRCRVEWKARGVSSTGNRVEYRGNGRGAALNNSVTDWSGELGGS